MLYSELDEINEIKSINDVIEINDSSANMILDDYETLKLNLVEFKKNFANLNKQKETYDNYLNELINNHMNIVNIVDNDDILNNSFNNYQKDIKDKYEKWIFNHFIVQNKILEDNIKNVENKIADFNNLFINIINNFIKDKEISKNTCPICFENQIDICLNPCGHTLCNKCSVNNYYYYNNGNCFICRKPVKEYIKIYFSL